MSRSLKLFLSDILDRCQKIELAIDGKNLDSFKTDDILHEALLRHLTIIGEAVKSIPEETRLQASDVPWRKIAGLRDILVHVYFGVRDEIVWDILLNDIAPLKAAVRSLLALDEEE